jgi:hypothetical protein
MREKPGMLFIDEYHHDLADLGPEAKEVRCHDCKKWIPLSEWKAIDLWCELCDEHSGAYHPNDDWCAGIDLIMEKVEWR